MQSPACAQPRAEKPSFHRGCAPDSSGDHRCDGVSYDQKTSSDHPLYTQLLWASGWHSPIDIMTRRVKGLCHPEAWVERNQMRSGRMARNIESTERSWQRSLQREAWKEQWPEGTGHRALGCPGRKTTAPGHFPILPQGMSKDRLHCFQVSGMWQ